MYLYVIFSSAHPARPRSLRAWLRLGLRAPRLVWKAMLHQAIVWCSGSSVTHVAVSDGEVVLSPGLDGNRWWAWWLYTERCPGLVGAYAVPIQYDPSWLFEHYPVGEPKQAWRTFMRWLTGGRWEFGATDCVTMTLEVLAVAGVRPPAWITTPVALGRWLHDEGYDWRAAHVQQDSNPMAPSGPSDSRRNRA